MKFLKIQSIKLFRNQNIFAITKNRYKNMLNLYKTNCKWLAIQLMKIRVTS